MVALLCLSEDIPAQQPSDVSADAETSAASAPQASSNTNAERTVSWKRLIPNLLQDQKSIWLFPARVAQGKRLKSTLVFAMITSCLIALDPHDTPYFRRTDSFHDVNKILSGRNTALGSAVLPLSFYAVGLARRDSYAQQTALLAGQAVVGAQILTTVMKNIDRRLRPIDVSPNGDFSRTWFKSHGRVIRGRGSFPSGHAIAAFSVATTFAERYPSRWVPWVAYSLAGAVGFSRVTLQSHFPSDVVVGAALGYLISRCVVLRKQ